MSRDFLILLLALLLAACTTVDVGGPTTRKNNPNAGVLTLDNGKRFAVLPEELNFTGRGTYRWPDGKEQSGDWVTGKLNGLGSETTARETYKGQWTNGVRDGHGEVRSSDTHYLGGFRDNLRHGAGTETTNEGIYKGQWVSDRKNGHGRFDGTDGSSYEGQWMMGVRAGYGRSIDTDGEEYEGDWMNSVPHGFGTQILADRAVYAGSWVNGHREGYGKLTTVSSLVYEGTWSNNLRSGFGREVRPDKSYYEGEWLEGKKHGEGSEVFADGMRHDGGWDAGYILGPGTRTFRSGITITGLWTQNVLSHGLIALPSGAEFAGTLFRKNGTEVSKPLLDWLTQKAAEGDPYAQLYLGVAYLDFTHPQPDTKTARIWLEQGASSGIAEAQFRFALLLTDTDARGHVRLLEGAAEADHARAHELLGELYHLGKYVDQNLQTATTHYEKAIDGGSIVAANNLAWLLATTQDDELVDPRRAIDLILPMVLYYGDWQHLDTLAAAQARNGNLELATSMQEQALREAKNYAAGDDLLAELEERLERYAAGEVYTE